MFDLGTHSTLMGDALWSFCNMAGPWAPLQNCFMVLDPCGSLKFASCSWLCVMSMALCAALEVTVAKKWEYFFLEKLLFQHLYCYTPLY